ncbi:glycosyltransferase family 2 protein [Thalassospira alkalitolerans]|uniref:glycosyltransferase family 2 protein n=1 Tax=Thalassospira alkalitolerans TaxID=1293890 RepID=UPI003AA9B89B
MTPPNPDAITIITTIRDGQDFHTQYFANINAILRPGDQVVIVDDGSVHPVKRPDTLAVPPRIKLIQSGKIGRGAALNLAISQAQTAFVAIQDIDDLSHPNRLNVQGKFLNTHPDTLAFTTAQSDRASAYSDWREIPAKRLYRSNPLHHSSLMFHRNIWDRAGGYDPDLDCCIDLDFYLRAVSRAKASIWQSNQALIIRNLDPATRHFAGISTRQYHQTLQSVLNRHRAQIAPPAWMRIYDMKRAVGSRL